MEPLRCFVAPACYNAGLVGGDYLWHVTSYSQLFDSSKESRRHIPYAEPLVLENNATRLHHIPYVLVSLQACH
jgi:hypothetical protein